MEGNIVPLIPGPQVLCEVDGLPFSGFVVCDRAFMCAQKTFWNRAGGGLAGGFTSDQLDFKFSDQLRGSSWINVDRKQDWLSEISGPFQQQGRRFCTIPGWKRPWQ
jgi:hypothetical protein